MSAGPDSAIAVQKNPSDVEFVHNLASRTLADPLSEASRKRQYLLLVLSVIAILAAMSFVTVGGNFFGITVTGQGNRAVLILVLGCCCLYCGIVYWSAASAEQLMNEYNVAAAMEQLEPYKARFQKTIQAIRDAMAEFESRHATLSSEYNRCAQQMSEEIDMIHRQMKVVESDIQSNLNSLESEIATLREQPENAEVLRTIRDKMAAKRPLRDEMNALFDVTMKEVEEVRAKYAPQLDSLLREMDAARARVDTQVAYEADLNAAVMLADLIEKRARLAYARSVLEVWFPSILAIVACAISLFNSASLFYHLPPETLPK